MNVVLFSTQRCCSRYQSGFYVTVSFKTERLCHIVSIANNFILYSRICWTPAFWQVWFASICMVKLKILITIRLYFVRLTFALRKKLQISHLEQKVLKINSWDFCKRYFNAKDTENKRCSFYTTNQIKNLCSHFYFLLQINVFLLLNS